MRGAPGSALLPGRMGRHTVPAIADPIPVQARIVHHGSSRWIPNTPCDPTLATAIIYDMALEPWVIKLARADQVLEELSAEVAAYLGGRIVRIEQRRDAPDVDAWSLFLRVLSEPDPMWSALVGDILHNCRSALDSFAYQTISAHEPNLNSQARRDIYFPITNSPVDFVNGWVNKSRACAAANSPARARYSPAVIEAFKHAQPWYDPWMGEIPDQYRTEHVAWQPIVRLRSLSNQDKHHNIHVVGYAVPFHWTGTDLGETAWFEYADPEPLRDGIKIGTWHYQGRTTSRSPEFGADVKVALAQDMGPGTVTPLSDRMAGLISAARRAIEVVSMSRVQEGAP